MKINIEQLKQMMTSQTYKNDVVANNLANINTIGYKKDISFVEALTNAEENVKLKVQTDFSQGTLKETGNPFDLALNGKGFFTIEKGNDFYLTRDGHFSVNGDGFLVTSSGYKVLGTSGAVHLGMDGEQVGEISISQIGEIYVDDELIDTLQVVDTADYSQLEKAGNNLFKTRKGTEVFVSENTSVIQGNLESSNVNVVNEMIGLMDIQRNFESSQRAIRTIDEALRKAANEVGRYR